MRESWVQFKLWFLYKFRSGFISVMPPGLLERWSHELRTSLTGIIGYAEFLESESVQPMIKFTANIIHENSLHLTRTSNAFINYQYLLQNKIVLSYIRFNYYAFFLSVLNESKLHSKNRNIHINLDCSSEHKKISINSDIDRHRCVLDGLIFDVVNMSKSNESINIKLSHDGLNNRLILLFEFHISDKFKTQEWLFVNFWNDYFYIFKLQEGPGVELAYIKKLLYFLNGSGFYRANQGFPSQVIIHLPLDRSF